MFNLKTSAHTHTHTHITKGRQISLAYLEIVVKKHSDKGQFWTEKELLWRNEKDKEEL
jgi:hypothetical protein